ncbi:MAG TPA: rod shape-determining protein MreC [Candidatus Paceibacterota bacterium]
MNNRRQRKQLLIATTLIALVLSVDVFSGGAIRTSLRSLSSAAWGAGSSVLARIGQSGFFSSRASLARENQLLKEEIAMLQLRSAAYSALKQENEHLRAIVHIAQLKQGFTAPVISSLRASPYGTFMIGVGEADGVAKGSLVVGGDGFVIGRIADVSPHRSLVSEVFAPGTSIESSVGGTPVLLTGRGGGNGVGNLPRGTSVSEGDPVLAPTLGQRAIGIVGRVEGGAASASTKIYVRSPVNLESLSFVYVELAP